MQEKIKSMEILESGYLQLYLTSKTDVDDYMLKLMHEHEMALSCMQDKRAKTKFFYDVKGFVSLEVFLSLWRFSKISAIPFLWKLFDELAVLDETLPMLLQCDAIYVNTQNAYKVVVLPIHEHHNEHNDVQAFLKEIMGKIQVVDSYEVIGYLYHVQNLAMHSLNDVKKALEPFMKKPNWVSPLALYRRKQENQDREDENIVRCDREIGRLRLLQEANAIPEILPRAKKREEVKQAGDTVVLFSQKLKQAYVEDHKSHRYAIAEELLMGRGKTCDLVISDATISSRHACIRKNSSGYEIEDLHSSNQTKLNGKKLKANQSYELHHEDVISLAEIELFFYEEEGR